LSIAICGYSSENRVQRLHEAINPDAETLREPATTRQHAVAVVLSHERALETLRERDESCFLLPDGAVAHEEEDFAAGRGE
jgi:hypothetical protein